MGHELTHGVRRPPLASTPAPEPAPEPATRARGVEATAGSDPEALLRTFQQQAKILKLLEHKLGPEGEELRVALQDAQAILNALLQETLAKDEV